MNRFWGKVRKVNLRGRKLGFPTANVNLNKDIAEGIYISKTKLQGKEFPSLTFIGKVKTFNEQKFQSETYILDFNKNIYHKWISVKLIKKIREIPVAYAADSCNPQVSPVFKIRINSLKAPVCGRP